MYAKLGYNPVFELALALIVFDLVLRFSAIERKHARNWLPELPAQHGGLPATSEPSSTPLPPPPPPPSPPSPPRSPPPSEEQYLPPPPPSFRSRLPPVLTLLASRRLLAALWGTLAVASLFSGLEATLPLHTAAAFGWRSAGAGLVFVPLSATAFLGPAVGRACDRHGGGGGTRAPTVAGFALLLPAFAALRGVTGPVATAGQQALLYALLALVGVCFALTLNPLMAEIAYVVEARSARRRRCSGERLGSGHSGGGGDGDAEVGGDEAAAASMLSMSAGRDEEEGGIGSVRRGEMLAAAAEREAVSVPHDGGESGGESGNSHGPLLPNTVDNVVRGEEGDGSEAAYAQAFALFSMAYSLGNAFGPLGAGLVRDAGGWAAMCWALGILSGVSAVVAGLWTGH
jgi:hypothetical protein